MNTAGGRRRKTATAQAKVRSNPVAVRFAIVRSQRWHSATPPAGSSGTCCIHPQSAQVIVMRRDGAAARRVPVLRPARQSFRNNTAPNATPLHQRRDLEKARPHFPAAVLCAGGPRLLLKVAIARGDDEIGR